MRTESYDFKKFINGKRVPINKSAATVLYSLGTPISIASLFQMSPMMKTGFAIVIGVGVLAIGSAIYERKLYKRNEDEAERFGMIISVLIIAACVFGVGYLFLHNPLWRFWQ
ncbi:Na+/pantothenate symporter [Pullulanibacillus pueri]|uniref:Uncharacterized protein n=1 Tax=Pullulanibacillus pueri TaxID=1437324 RepID=A0A8J3EML9_9BACL|nr:hypothetical protein [Pullulanibacillus pueri]MBM7683740.1 Na+/pantothenate symporter [Pullulanibacillus pueri]GGH85111.1 hypothetical protein GCM10007096_29740 [Pullulanibacillus pueri]